MCEGFRKSNFDPGGFADFFRVPEYNVSRNGVHKFTNISFDEASFVEPLGCCIRGLEKALRSRLRDAISSSSYEKVDGPTNALIVGAGPIGLLHMELLKSTFPKSNLVAVDVIESRLRFAESFEKALPISPKTDGSFLEQAKSIVQGPGYDLVIVATGSPRAFAEAIRCVRKSGSFLLFGAPAKGSTYTIDLQSMLLSELSIVTSYATTEREMSDALWLLEQRKISVAKFVTSRIPLNEINRAMREARSEGQMKVIVTR